MGKPFEVATHQEITNRRSFLKKGVVAAGAVTVGTGLLADNSSVASGDRSDAHSSIIRPTETDGIAMGVVNFLTAMGLFAGQTNPQFFELLKDLAADADHARHGS